MDSSKRIKSGLWQILRKLNYNGEISDKMFSAIRKQHPTYDDLLTRSGWIFQKENKRFCYTQIPHEIQMCYSSRWNQLDFRIQVGRTRMYRRAAELFFPVSEKRMEELKEEQERFEKNRIELEKYLKVES
ncbi:MAG: hypothetical protein JSW11_01620 [Candidatus Heimdallarchaeota archaeon]|nr:MAG: hypothetical protein JSW11_01620 [Candidatus Heimdallarchaeota archaeon]